MTHVRVGMAALALALALAPLGCGTRGPEIAPGQPADPQASLLRCLHGADLPARRAGSDEIALGGPQAPRVVLGSNPGEVATADLRGRAEAAERIGGALLYVGDAPDRELRLIERCLERSGPPGRG